MIFNEGDTVKVVNADTPHSGVEGKTGTVLHVFEGNQTCSVQLEWDAPEGSGWEKQGALSSFSFSFSELEVIKAVDQEEQIFKIAAVLHTEGPYGNVPWAEIKADAARFYKAGIRHHG